MFERNYAITSGVYKSERCSFGFVNGRKYLAPCIPGVDSIARRDEPERLMVQLFETESFK